MRNQPAFLHRDDDHRHPEGSIILVWDVSLPTTPRFTVQNRQQTGPMKLLTLIFRRKSILLPNQPCLVHRSKLYNSSLVIVITAPRVVYFTVPHFPPQNRALSSSHGAVPTSRQQQLADYQRCIRNVCTYVHISAQCFAADDKMMHNVAIRVKN